jgi:hypothetical protein
MHNLDGLSGTGISRNNKKLICKECKTELEGDDAFCGYCDCGKQFIEENEILCVFNPLGNNCKHFCNKYCLIQSLYHAEIKKSKVIEKVKK